MLRAEHVVAPLPADTVQGAVSVLAQRLIDGGAVEQPERLARLFSENRVRDLIRVGDRVLLSHLRTDAVRDLVVALGVASAPLAETPPVEDGQARLVVLVLAPPTAAGLYLQTVAALARVLRDDSVVDAMLSAQSAEAVLAIPAIQGITIQPRLTVRDVMTQRVHRVGPDDPVRDVLDLVAAHRLRAVPVVQRTSGVSPAALKETRVREVMSRSVICVSEDQALAEVMSIMVTKDLERLPVVSEGKLTGFLTRGDILRKLFA